MCTVKLCKYVYIRMYIFLVITTYVHISPVAGVIFVLLRSYVAINYSNIVGIAIINGPRDTTVCMDAVATCNCGFSGTDPVHVVPNWKITFRRDDGSIISNNSIPGYKILHGFISRLRWLPDLTSGDNHAPNSKLLVGPVNMTHNQSSYQCIIVSVNGPVISSVISSVGIMTVVGKTTIVTPIII